VGPAGEEVADKFATTFTYELKRLSPENQQKAFESLLAIDWSDWDALDQAKNIFKELGIEISTDSDEWSKFEDELRKATRATPDYSKLQESL
jgi:hypothetical protein